MSDPLRRMMQENLDGELSEDLIDELYDMLDEDTDAAREYARLESVDRLLGTAPHARAPQRLAVTIMARLAESIEAEAELHAMPEEIRQALMLSVSLVIVSTMPMMLAASYMVMTGMRQPEYLNRVIAHILSLMVMLIDALKILLEEMETIVRENPEMAPMAMALIPITLMSMLDYIEQETMP
jgi:hypothetical protein